MFTIDKLIPIGYDPAGALEDYGNDNFQTGDNDGYNDFEDVEFDKESGEYAAAQRYVAAKNQRQIDGRRGVDLNDVLSLAKAVEDFVNPYNPEEEREKKKKYVSKGDHKRRKKKVLTHDEDQDLSM